MLCSLSRKHQAFSRGLSSRFTACLIAFSDASFCFFLSSLLTMPYLSSPTGSSTFAPCHKCLQLASITKNRVSPFSLPALMFPHPFLKVFGCRILNLRSWGPKRLFLCSLISFGLRHDYCPPNHISCSKVDYIPVRSFCQPST